jgi:hypothetical protein
VISTKICYVGLRKKMTYVAEKNTFINEVNSS